MKKILILSLSMIPFVSNASNVGENMYFSLVEIHSLGSHQCKTNFRPITYNEAEYYKQSFKDTMEEWQITSLESPWKISGSGYGNTIENGGANDTFCYPNPTNNPPKFDLNLLSLQSGGNNKCLDNYRPLTQFEASGNLEAISNKMSGYQIVALEFPWIVMGRNHNNEIKNGSSNYTWCYPKAEPVMQYFSSSSDYILMFEHSNMGGEGIKIKTSIGDLGSFKNRMSSFIIPEGMTARFYDGVNFSGNFYSRGGSENIVEVEINDRIKSVEIL